MRGAFTEYEITLASLYKVVTAVAENPLARGLVERMRVDIHADCVIFDSPLDSRPTSATVGGATPPPTPRSQRMSENGGAPPHWKSASLAMTPNSGIMGAMTNANRGGFSNDYHSYEPGLSSSNSFHIMYLMVKARRASASRTREKYQKNVTQHTCTCRECRDCALVYAFKTIFRSAVEQGCNQAVLNVLRALRGAILDPTVAQFLATYVDDVVVFVAAFDEE